MLRQMRKRRKTIDKEYAKSDMLTISNGRQGGDKWKWIMMREKEKMEKETQEKGYNGRRYQDVEWNKYGKKEER